MNLFLINFTLSYLFTGLILLVLAIFVYCKNRKNWVNKIFAVYSLSISWWSLCSIFLINAPNQESGMFWDRMCLIGVVFIPTVFLHFNFTFLRVSEKYKNVIKFCYLLSLFFLISNFTPFFTVPGPIYYAFMIYFLTAVVFGIYILYKNLKAATPGTYYKQQITYLFWSTLLGYTGGSLSYNLFLNGQPYRMIPFGNYLIGICGLIIAYAIIKYRFMQIDLLIRKTLVFGGFFTSVFMIFVLITVVGGEFLNGILGEAGRWVSITLIVFIVTFSARPIENFLIHLTDRFLFQKKYNYRQTLKEASESMTLVTDMKKLLNLIVRVLSKSIKVKGVAVFQHEKIIDKYVLKTKRGTVKKTKGYTLGFDSAIPSWLREKKGVILYDEIEYWLNFSPIVSRDKNLKYQIMKLKEELSKMNAAICVPSFSKGHLIGFLILGEKLSGDIYTQEDIQLLSTLASEAAIAAENANNFMELEKMRENERESYIQTVMALAQTVDEKDSYTHSHLENVSYYGMQIAEELQKSSEFKGSINRDDLKAALSLHDIGKIGVPDAILNKNGKLTPQEWDIMKRHCEIGARIVESIEKLKNVGDIIKHHQEKYDGTGYPDALKGEEIPLEARIISVVDAYHAMVSDRPYRKALPKEVALAELKKNIGTQFDPVIVGTFLRAWRKGKMRRV